jgi:multiple sugar transport system permease protein
LLFLTLRLLDTYPALILSHLSITLPLVIWLSIGFFEEVPSELMDAAAIDGASVAQIFRLVALPLVKAGTVSAGVLAFVASWNNFLYSVVLGGTLRLAPVATYNLIKEVDTNWGVLSAAAVITTWPVIILALPFARDMVRGLTAGAVKG